MMDSTDPTDVPPNFKIFICLALGNYKKKAPSPLSEEGAFDVFMFVITPYNLPSPPERGGRCCCCGIKVRIHFFLWRKLRC